MAKKNKLAEKRLKEAKKLEKERLEEVQSHTLDIMEHRKIIQTKIRDEEADGVEAYKEHLEDIKEAKKKKMEDARL